MRIEYILNRTDLSFDYSDYRTHYEYKYNGFNIDIDIKDVINIDSLEPFGDCVDVMQDVKTLNDLKQFITDNYNVIDDENKEVFNELLEFIKEQEKMEVENYELIS